MKDALGQSKSSFLQKTLPTHKQRSPLTTMQNEADFSHQYLRPME